MRSDALSASARRAVVAATLVLAGGAAQEPVVVLTDGRFDDWRDAPLLVADDPSDAAPGAAVDFGSVFVQDDPAYLHLAVDVGRQVNAQAMRGTVRILFDADGDVTTGATVREMPGVDAILELSRMEKPQPGGYGAGVGVRPVSSGEVGEIRAGYALGALVAPTHSASRLEIRLARGASPGTRQPVFQNAVMRARLVFERNGVAGDVTPVAQYVFRTRHVAGSPAGSLSVARHPATMRVVQWNVASNRFRQEPEAYNRLLAALDPDVILLDEVYGAVTEDDLERFLAMPPLGERAQWRFALGRTGGRQRAVVAARWPVREEPLLVDVPYAPGALDSLERVVGDERFARLFALERERGVAAAGGWVAAPGGADVLFVSLDLQSAGYDGSAQDRLRELQAETVRERVEAVAGAGPFAPVVVAGDLNLVGSDRPLRVLLGRAGRPPRLTPADAYRLGDRSQATWRSDSPEPFTPGRLDYVLFSPRSLVADRAFVFEVREVRDDSLVRMGLETGEAGAPSDHLPVVVDLRRR